MKRSFDDYLNRKHAECAREGHTFDASALDRRFVPAFESGARIRVKYKESDRVMTGTVGVTTGWRPAFILMRSPNARGSSDVLGSDIEFTNEKIKTGRRAAGHLK